MTIKAVAVDLDGTLLNSSKQVSERNCTALLNAYQMGMRVIIATARPPRSVEWLLPKQLQEICSFVYYNGAMINCRYSDLAFHQGIDSSLSEQILQHLLQDEDVVISFEVADAWYALKPFDPSIIQAVGGEPIIKSVEELQAISPTKIIASGIKQANAVTDKFGEKVNILVTDRGQLMQISHVQSSKEAGVQRLCESYGISIQEVIAFGDDTNDIGLIQACGYGVAMANGVQELKMMADEVTESNDDDGVAIVIERLLKKND